MGQLPTWPRAGVTYLPGQGDRAGEQLMEWSVVPRNVKSCEWKY